MAPRTSPASSRTGDAPCSTGTSVPVREISAVGLVIATSTRSRSARAIGSGIGSRVCSSTSFSTWEMGRPRASARGQPVRVSATGLKKVTHPSRSVAITPSPMLKSVAESRRRLSRSDAVTQVSSDPISTKIRTLASRLKDGTWAAGSGRRKKKRMPIAEAAVAVSPPVRPWNQALNQIATRNKALRFGSRIPRSSSDARTAVAERANANTPL